MFEKFAVEMKENYDCICSKIVNCEEYNQNNCFTY